MPENLQLSLKDIVPEELQHAAKKLGSDEVPRDLVAGDLEKDLPIKVDEVTFSLSGEASIDVFNSEDDLEKGDPVLGKPVVSTDEGSMELPPQIEFSTDHAWIRYAAGAKAKAQGGLKDSGFNFSAEAEGSLDLDGYRIHSRDQLVGLAVAADLGSPKLALVADHVLALSPGEAVSMRVRGKLDLGISVSWADVFAGNLSGLGRLLDAGETFALKIDAGLTASFDVSLEDDYQLIFSRSLTDEKLRVAIKKSDKSSLALAIAAKVGVEFANPEQVQMVLGSVLDGLIGEPLQEIEGLLAKANSFASLDDEKQQLVERLLDRFGLESPADRLEALGKKLEELKKDARDAIEEIAKTRVELGFTYEYSRVRTTTVVLQAVVEDEAIAEFHGDLLRGRLAGFLEAPGVALETYLKEKSLEVKHAFGLGLSVGEWFKVSGKDVIELEEVIRETADGRQQIALSGARGYSGAWINDQDRWMVDFSGEMPEFSASAQGATADEFDYALQALLEFTEATVARDEVTKLVDEGVNWGTVTHGQAAAESERLGRQLSRKRAVTFNYQLKLDDVAFREILKDLATDMTAEYAAALGQATPWRDMAGRDNPRDRRQLYGKLWQTYLENPDLTPKALSQTAKSFLKSEGFGELGTLEGQQFSNGLFPPGTIAELARLNPDLRRMWRNFARGMTDLATAIRSSQSHRMILKAWGKGASPGFRHLFSQSLTMRAMCVLLLDRVRLHADLEDHVESVFSISYKEGGKPVVETLGTSG